MLLVVRYPYGMRQSPLLELLPVVPEQDLKMRAYSENEMLREVLAVREFLVSFDMVIWVSIVRMQNDQDDPAVPIRYQLN